MKKRTCDGSHFHLKRYVLSLKTNLIFLCLIVLVLLILRNQFPAGFVFTDLLLR